MPGGVQATQSGEGWVLEGAKGPIPFGESATHLIVSARAEEGTVLVVVDAPQVTDGVLGSGQRGRLLLSGAAAAESLNRALALQEEGGTGVAPRTACNDRRERHRIDARTLLATLA